MSWIIAALILVVLMAVGGLALRSRGTPPSYRDAQGRTLAGSLSEKIRVRVNGVDQGMIIRSRDIANPVLLFVHGGPGMPTFFLNERYPTGLDDYMTVCWWEQRGAGLSYRADDSPGSLTVEQLIADTLAVTEYLLQRFHQPKLYLMGHSWGSFIALQAAARAPHMYCAYIGVAQVTYQLRSEALAYAYMLKRFQELGDSRMARKLEAAPVTMDQRLPDAYNALRDDAMHRLGIGTTRDMRSVVTGVFLASWLSPIYTIGEKLALWRGKIASKRILWDDFIGTDLTERVKSLDVPVYFLHGKYDYTVSYPEAKAYMQRLNAPLKGFYTFEDSAHSPIHEEPERTRRIMQQDVLAGDVSLADSAL